MAGAILLAMVGALAAAAILLVTSKARILADPVALAKVDLPLGGGMIQSVSVVSGPHSSPIPVGIRGNQIWPSHVIPAGEQVSIEVVVKRPSSIGWLTGATKRLDLTLTTPATRLQQQYMTVSGKQPLTVRFTQPVVSYAYGQPGQLQRHALRSPQQTVILPRSAPAGSIYVSGMPRSWETAAPELISWFPAGTAAAVVTTPAPGTSITATTPISLTFSKPYSQVLGQSLPPVSPTTVGTWHPVNSHTITFRPDGFGYGLGAHVKVGLPSNVGVVGGAAAWSVPPGSTLRLQQILATLDYLPLDFNSASTVAPTPQAQEAAAVKPPQGSFSWRYGNVPSALHNMWAPGASGEMTKGALMMFQNDHSLTADGDAGPATWRALIGAAIAGHPSGFGYSFVTVNRSSQSLTLWHNGHTVVTTPVNTGIAQAPTAPGTFAVYEHLRVTTMSGTNPDGSHYNDPGIQFVSYFNGGDALHAFTRAQYGFPQSLGCVEMALGPAAQVWPYTPIGTLVNVA
jgi:hypothetical protein